MSQAMRLGALALALACGMASAASAQQVWVKGEVRLNLRSGPSNANRILGLIKTGDALTILGRSPDEKWTHVRTRDGKEGWIPAGFLEVEPPPSVRLAQLEEETAKLQAQLERVTGEASELRESNTTLASDDEAQREELERLTRENFELRAGARWPEWITGALILSTGMVLGAILSRISGRGRRQRIRL